MGVVDVLSGQSAVVSSWRGPDITGVPGRSLGTGAVCWPCSRPGYDLPGSYRVGHFPTWSEMCRV